MFLQWTKQKTKTKVRIVYKSGYVQDITCESFEVKWVGGTLTEVNWVDAKPDPLFVGVNNIESVWVKK